MKENINIAIEGISVLNDSELLLIDGGASLADHIEAITHALGYGVGYASATSWDFAFGLWDGFCGK